MNCLNALQRRLKFALSLNKTQQIIAEGKRYRLLFIKNIYKIRFKNCIWNIYFPKHVLLYSVWVKYQNVSKDFPFVSNAKDQLTFLNYVHDFCLVLT